MVDVPKFRTLFFFYSQNVGYKGPIHNKLDRITHGEDPDQTVSSCFTLLIQDKIIVSLQYELLFGY